MSPERPVIVETRGLTVTVPGPPSYDIVHDINLTLRAGDVFGLVGESGSGKTTTALSMLGYTRSGTDVSGSVRIEGAEMIGASEAELRASRGHLVSYVPQDPTTSLNPSMRIGPQLEEMLAPSRRAQRSMDRSRIEELLAKVQLPNSRQFLHRFPHQLSGGQLQRVCIAMAMLNRPRLIVFDEPTTGLDVTTQGHVLDTIRELIGSEDSAALYVTHDLAVIGEIANRVGVMYAGLMVEQSDTETVLHHSGHPYAKRLVLATPSVRERRELVGIPGTPLNPKDRTAGCPFAVRCDFVEQRCLEELPELVELSPTHSARCHRSEFVASANDEIFTHPARATWVQRERILGIEQKPVLHVAGVRASYGRNLILHDVDMTIAEGECMALVGESGSGKTTLARCVSGLHKDGVEGVLEFEGHPLDWSTKNRPDVALHEIQYVFQNPYASLNPRHTIGHIIAQPLETFGIGKDAIERRERVRQLLGRVALSPDYEGRYPSQLSGGERQRVAIARALAAEPKLLVCDEVTSSLDVSIQASILELLGQLREESNLTMLFITHHLGLVRAIADQIVILQHGRVVEHGPAEGILDDPSDAYTRELLDNTPVLALAGSAS